MSFTIFAAALIAAAASVAVISDRHPGKSDAAVPATASKPVASAASSLTSPSTTIPVRVAKEVPAAEIDRAPLQPETVAAAQARPSAAPARSESSLFRVESLPVLEAHATGFDPDESAPVVAPPTRAASRSLRRAPSAAR